MRIRTLPIFFSFAVAVCSARADVIFSGDVNASSTVTPPCSAGGSGDGSLSIGCSIGNSVVEGNGSVQGSGNAYSGYLSVTSGQYSPENDPYETVHVFANGGLELSETYVLIGGVGPATVNLNLTSNFGDPAMGDYYACAFAFDGASQPCELGGPPHSEQVEYWVPFSVSLNVQMSTVAESFTGPGQFASFGYDFEQPGLFALPLPMPTPEPSSALLLLPGLAGVLFAARSRARRLLAKS
ncbi:MAG TPA: hypothetical protein VFA99_09665 [Acidobacteriaceae bacterium]|nr:hypothetical protein [Acidobacteriaceae bacterium]